MTDFSTTYETINKLINGLTAEIEKIGDSDSIPDHIVKNNLYLKIERLKKIQEILQIKKYNIVFIGTIGAGKTTAICHLFNLIGEFSGEDRKGKQINKTSVLLSAKGGRTTICEVIIKAGDKSNIEIEPYSIEEMEKLISDFYESFSDIKGMPLKGVLSTEVDRAIRNITDFRYEYPTISGKKLKIDKAQEAFDGFGVKDFMELALSNAELTKRTNTKIDFEGIDEKTWLKETFDSINFGERKDFAIPRKIFVTVSKNVLLGSDLSLFESVIDTKGVDETPYRKDLEEYINREDTICLFTTSFNDAPSTDIRELMRHSLQNKSSNFHHRFSVFVMPKKGEPEAANGADGDRELGIVIKKGEILDVFKNMNLEFIQDNIIFFDSLRFYRDDGRIDQDYDLEDIQQDKETTIEQIKQIIEHRKMLLKKEIDDIESNFEIIKSGKNSFEQEMNLINEAVERLKNLRGLENIIQSWIYEESIEEFIKYYNGHYKAWNTKHAIHRRYGTYDIRDIDLFYDVSIVCEGTDEDKVLRKYTKEPKQKIVAILDSLNDSGLETLMPTLIEKFEANYTNFIKESGSSVEEFMREDKFSPQDEDSNFWNALIAEKGKPRGPGETYTDNVCTIMRHELESNNSLNIFLKKTAEKNWAQLVDKTLEYFGVKNAFSEI